MWRLGAVPLDDERIDPLLRRSAQLLLAAVVALLLIVCVNLANLMLVRGLGRQRETAIRLALGASRVRIVRQLMTESAVLAAAGAACGLAVAYSVMVGAATLMPDLRTVLRGPTAGLTRVGLSMLGFDFRTAIFACACAVGTAVLFGGVPAWRASRRDVAAIMKEGAAGAIGTSARSSSGRNLLMAGELALALMLLVAAGLMLKSTFRLHATPLGIRPDALVTFRVAFPSPEYTAATATARLEQLLDRLRARGDVESAAYGNCAPVSGGCSATIASFPDRPPAPPGHETLVGVYWADPVYFQTLGIPLLQGRVFENRDRVGQPKVAVVSDAAARAFWPNQNPLGKRVGLGMGGFIDGAEVIGVVGDVRYRTIETAVGPDIYIPLFQSPSSGGLVFVRSRSTLDTMASTIRAELEAIDRNLPIVDLKTMDERLGDATWRTRMSAWLLGTFAALAVLLGAVGVYGVMSQGVEQRRREIGVRMALGAGHAEIARMVLGRGVRISVGGVVLGLALAIPSARLLSALLYDVTPGDPIVLVSLASLLVFVALVASYIPARRAARVDPLTTLRAE